MKEVDKCFVLCVFVCVFVFWSERAYLKRRLRQSTHPQSVMQDGGKSLLPSISLPSNDTPGEARDFNPNDGSYSEPYKYHEDHSYAKSKFYFF